MEDAELQELFKNAYRVARYYPDGDFRCLYPRSHGFTKEYESVEHWYKYNSTYRFGQALFIDGICVYKGIGHTPLALERYAAAELVHVNAFRESERRESQPVGERFDGQA